MRPYQVRNNGNEGALCILQSFKTGASPSDCFVSYPDHSLWESYSSVELQSAYSTAQPTGPFLGLFGLLFHIVLSNTIDF